MIVKERKYPRTLQKLDALLKRLHSQHPKIPLIQEEWKKRKAGYKGEASIDYPLSFLDPSEYFIFHDLRLQDTNSYFQIDTLILSKKFFLIIEVKNLAGTIFFDSVFNQLIQLKDGQETAFSDPTIQIQRQENQLKKWLVDKGIPLVPISSIVVISNDRTIIKSSPEDKYLNEKVIHRHLLPQKIDKIKTSKIGNSLSDKQTKKVIRLLKKHHNEANYSILKRFNLTKEDLLPGVFCGNCDYAPLERRHGTWFCPRCLIKDSKAHLQALKDYELLISPTISNQELRSYLCIPSTYVASRILKAMNLPQIGNNKGRKYTLTSPKK
ncbi:nuclease-related domain-containing protein [Rossellomorea aquimaris]|uniref:nuclease-related domain-containing protein n=1 Tax=Rossellomorea aquimaris TaxID=189382 RepID=UPI0007D091CB|nr:nuclease-related domain-containing protein [Rossellomorea aquimaris]